MNQGATYALANIMRQTLSQALPACQNNLSTYWFMQRGVDPFPESSLPQPLKLEPLAKSLGYLRIAFDLDAAIGDGRLQVDPAA